MTIHLRLAYGSLQPTAAGAYQFRAVATDAAGNRSSPVSKGFRVVLV